jgi:hypothetical protein
LQSRDGFGASIELVSDTDVFRYAVSEQERQEVYGDRITPVPLVIVVVICR